MEMKRRMCGNCSRYIQPKPSNWRRHKSRSDNQDTQRSRNSLASKAAPDGDIDSNLVRIFFLGNQCSIIRNSISRLHIHVHRKQKCGENAVAGIELADCRSIQFRLIIVIMWMTWKRTYIAHAPDAERWDRRRWRRLGSYLPAVACVLKHTSHHVTDSADQAQLHSRAGLTIVPVVPWEGAPAARGPPINCRNFYHAVWRLNV